MNLQKLRGPALDLDKAGPNVQSWIRERLMGNSLCRGAIDNGEGFWGEEVTVFAGNPHALMDSSTPMSVEAAPNSTQWVTEQNINRHER